MKWVLTFRASVLCFFILAGCSVDQSSDRSTVVLQMPAETLQKANDEASGFSQNSCFAVSIYQNRQENLATSCDRDYGEIAGFVAAGEAIELEVNQGNGYSIDLFYMEGNGQCEKIDMKKGFAKLYGSDRVHRIAHKKNLNFNTSEVEVHMGVEWPTSANTMSAVFSLPKGCQKDSTTPQLMAQGSVGTSLGTAHGTTTNGSFMRVRITNKLLDINHSGGFRVLPSRVGVGQ